MRTKRYCHIFCWNVARSLRCNTSDLLCTAAKNQQGISQHTSQYNMYFKIPWFVIFAAALHTNNPFLSPVYSTFVIVLYSFSFSMWWAHCHHTEWTNKTIATNSKNIIYFETAEVITTILNAFTSVYLLFPSIIPLWLFWCTLVTGLVSRYTLDYMWKRLLHRLTLS